MSYWSDQYVLITGHTGFKGAWLAESLLQKGARVFGAALPPEYDGSLFDRLKHADRLDHALVDIRNYQDLKARVRTVQPRLIIHMAACSLVRRSYREPLETWSTNVMGTVHLLEAVRSVGLDCAVLVVTTDKVYENNDANLAFREDSRLGGHDPYSASKAASEIAAHSYRESFKSATDFRLATARAGNVIGGGDFAEDRIVPDLVRAFSAGSVLDIRNPASTRPWQHVLDPLSGYLKLAQALLEEDDPAYQSAFNFGPSDEDSRSVAELVDVAQKVWPGEVIFGDADGAVREAQTLRLDIEKASRVLGWTPHWLFERAVSETVRWYHDVQVGRDPIEITQQQIADFEQAS